MKPSIDVQHVNGELVIRVRADAQPADALVQLSAEGLRPLGLELKSIVRLADSGALKTVQIGRSRFTTLRHVLALVDELPAARSVAPAPVDDLAEAAGRRAARLARRSA